MDELHGELGEYSKGLKAQVRLWTNTAAMTEFLPAALAPFLATRPNVDIVLKERLSAEIVKAVAGGVAEVGIVARAVDHANLAHFPFAVDRLVLVVPRDSEFAQAGRIAFSAIAAYPFVGLSAGSPLQDYLGEHAARAGHAVAFRVRLRTFDAICRMVAHGVGFGIVPETAARRCRRSMSIATVRLTDAWATRHLDVCVRDVDALTPVARELVECLSASARA
jgi:DNA-binding transcriptional LysR family regulator